MVKVKHGILRHIEYYEAGSSVTSVLNKNHSLVEILLKLNPVVSPILLVIKGSNCSLIV